MTIRGARQLIYLLALCTLPACTTGFRPAATPANTNYQDRVIGPTGLGPLHLGMTIQQAQATHLFGQLQLEEHPAGCAGASNQDLFIKYSAAYGVTLIGAEHGRTPEGIGAGSTLADVKRVYPQVAEPGIGTIDEQLAMFGDVEVQVPGNPAADYTINFDPQGHDHVRYVFLKLKAERLC